MIPPLTGKETEPQLSVLGKDADQGLGCTTGPPWAPLLAGHAHARLPALPLLGKLPAGPPPKVRNLKIAIQEQRQGHLSHT